MKKKYQVFISSTFNDLQEERAKVRDAILSMYHFPVGMEMFGAANESQWKIIQDTIDSSDYYVLLIAHRYGSIIMKGADVGISYTEKEFRYAVAKKIPVLAFIIDDNVKIKPQNFDVKNQEALKKFKNLVAKDRVIVKWRNSDDLAQKVTASLYNAIKEDVRPGWVRGNNSVIKSNEKLKKQIRLLKKEIAELRIENSVPKVNNRMPKLEVFFRPDTTDDMKHADLYERKDNITEDESGSYHLKVGNVNTTLIETEYMPKDRTVLPLNLSEYISDEEIEQYNAALPTKKELNDYINKYRNYQLIKKHGIAIEACIANGGNAKATDITVDLDFPDEIVVLDIDKVEEWTEPKALPKPKDLIQLAIEKRNAEDYFINPLYQKRNGIGESAVFPSTNFKNLIIPKLILPVNEEVIFLDNHNVRIRPRNGIVHTKLNLFSGLYIVPLFKGVFKVKATVMCAEYETFEEMTIDFICE